MIHLLTTDKKRHMSVILEIMDKRIVKSTSKLKEQYLKMLFEMDPSKIQVKELCLLANVNRSTFYDRYGFIEALEKEIIDEEMEHISFGSGQLDELPIESNGIAKSTIKKYIENFTGNKVIMRFCNASNREKYIDMITHKQVETSTSNLTRISYFDAYFQCIGVIATIIEWIINKRNQSLDDIVDVIHNHSIAMFKNKFKN